MAQEKESERIKSLAELGLISYQTFISNIKSETRGGLYKIFKIGWLYVTLKRENDELFAANTGDLFFYIGYVTRPMFLHMKSQNIGYLFQNYNTFYLKKFS